MANLVVAQLLFLESENPDKDVHLYVNSPGGAVTAGLRSTTRCSSSSLTSARSAWGRRRLDGRGGSLAAGAQGARSRCRIRGSWFTSRSAASTARRPTSRSTRAEILDAKSRAEQDPCCTTPASCSKDQQRPRPRQFHERGAGADYGIVDGVRKRGQAAAAAAKIERDLTGASRRQLVELKGFYRPKPACYIGWQPASRPTRARRMVDDTRGKHDDGKLLVLLLLRQEPA